MLDIGRNTGTFSRFAAGAGARVVAIDSDLESLDRLAATAAEKKLDIRPLAVDISRPTLATGWNCGESLSHYQRSQIARNRT